MTPEELNNAFLEAYHKPLAAMASAIRELLQEHLSELQDSPHYKSIMHWMDQADGYALEGLTEFPTGMQYGMLRTGWRKLFWELLNRGTNEDDKEAE